MNVSRPLYLSAAMVGLNTCGAPCACLCMCACMGNLPRDMISAAGFDPLKEGGVADAGRIEVPGGDLHQNGGLNGQLLDLDQARAAVAAGPTPAKA